MSADDILIDALVCLLVWVVLMLMVVGSRSVYLWLARTKQANDLDDDY